MSDEILEILNNQIKSKEMASFVAALKAVEDLILGETKEFEENNQPYEAKLFGCLLQKVKMIISVTEKEFSDKNINITEIVMYRRRDK